MPPKTLAEQCAERKAIRLRRAESRIPERKATKIRMLRANGVLPSVSHKLLRSYYMAERNSKQRGIDFSLSQSDLMALANRAGGRCEVTGIGFAVIDTQRKWDRQPWTASIDRIDCSKGYTFENCRLVCAAVNVALNAWGTPVLDRIVDAMVELRLRQREGYMDGLRIINKKILRRNKYLRRRARAMFHEERVPPPAPTLYVPYKSRYYRNAHKAVPT